jgi:hypothetical protein
MFPDRETELHESVARFMGQGLLRLTDVLPSEHFDELRVHMDRGDVYGPGRESGVAFTGDGPLERILASQKVTAVLDSLLGRNRELLRVSSHTTKPGEGGQPLHVDGPRDLRGSRFDVQLLIFPQQTTQDMGGTRLVPRSHLRLVDNSCVGRYQHLAGELNAAGPAGTVYLVHSRLWHSGLRNNSDRTRRMLRVRLRGLRQAACWNVPEKLLGTASVDDILFNRCRWEDSTSSREADYVLINMVRFLTGYLEYDHQCEYRLRYG